MLVVVWFGSCLQWDLTCGACLDAVAEREAVPYEWVDPCTLRYHDEPKEPGRPSPYINGIINPTEKVDPEHHLIYFPDCEPDAGIQGTVELHWIYDTHVEH
ncbi:MAG TPA: hypothetical protein VFA20_30340 [Myxococcaceae bacterium]|nr:hypothetical protein [Myxococcaceae bacterium]